MVSPVGVVCTLYSWELFKTYLKSYFQFSIKNKLIIHNIVMYLNLISF